MKTDIIIIGGGASGMMAAVSARMEGREVLLLEGSDRLGRKLLATGNGRCNFTHEDFSAEHYHTDDPRMLKNLFERFGETETLRFFSENGLLFKNKGGYYYPYSETAVSMLDFFKSMLSRLGCIIIPNAHVTRIQRSSNGFEVLGNGFRHNAKALILAAGTKAGGFYKEKDEGPYSLLKGLDVSISPLFPALTRVYSTEKDAKILSGVRCQGRVSLLIDDREAGYDSGEIQFTDSGLSGIVVFQLSGTAAEALAAGNKTEMVLDLFPDFSWEQLRAECEKRFELFKDESVEGFFQGMLHRKLMHFLIRKCGLKPEEKPDYRLKENRKRILHVLSLAKQWKIALQAVDSMEKAQVCRGGAYMNQFKNTLESKSVPGFFVCGELLNADGLCGGYNLQFAWTTGYLAGKGAARCLK